MKADVVSVIEAAYDVESPTTTWLSTLASAAEENVDFGLGVLAFLYRIGEDGRVSVEQEATRSIASDVAAPLRAALSSLSPEYVRETFAATPCALATEAGSAETRAQTRIAMKKHFGPLGWRDIFVVNGIDPTGRGVYVGVPVSRSVRPSAAVRTCWSRIAAHLATANRMRRRLEGLDSGPDTADAVLTPLGRVEHLANDAKSAEARAHLVAGARAIEAARGTIRARDPASAVAEWRGLVVARWTLIEHFESDGKRYLVARRNEAMRRGCEDLAPRERQALGFASLGHSNKLIAYEMGISASTVSVLLHRAAKKLGTNSRAALIAAYLAQTNGS